MSKSITFTNLLPPTNLTSSVVAGGTLATGSTYFYVVQACFDAGTTAVTTNGRSQSSNQVSSSVTTTGNQTVQLSWTASVDAGGYRVYRATSSGSYIEMLDTAVRTSVNCVGGICTINDTGLVIAGNTQYQNTVRGRLTLSGSTSSNPFSIVDLHNSSSAAGWGVVNRLDDDTYSVNTFINGHTNMFWNDIDKVIIFRDYLFAGSNGNYTFGQKSGLITRRGCRLIFKTPDIYTTSFSALFAYKTTFDYVRFNPLVAYSNISPLFISYNSGSVEFCSINKIRGFTPLSVSSCSMSDTVITEADVALGAGLGTFSNIVGIANSRVFQPQPNSQITGSNIRFIASGTTLLINNNFSIRYINSISASLGDSIANSSASGSTQDVFTYDLQVLTEAGLPISGASVRLADRSGSVVINTNTNISGNIPQQEVTLYRRMISGGLGPVQNLSPYTLTVEHPGYNFYRENTVYSSSLALLKTVSLIETGSLNSIIINLN